LLLGGGSALSESALGIALALLLLYVFLGIAVITDIFMEAITKITSRTETVQVKDLRGKTMELSVPIWNPRVANVTLLALGAAAPEIFLCFFSTFADIESAPKDIGPMALIGSASFNMLVVTGASIMAVGSVKKVLSLSTFIVTAAFACFAYLWLFMVLVVFSPAHIEFWEAMTTLLFYPLLLFFVWATEKCASENQSESEELDANRRMICK
jgi:Ca2+/Na+ antiporter